MQKIPTMFVRDEGPGPRLVFNQVAPGCEWVAAGEGEATRKFDGQCCMVEHEVFYKRREIKEGQIIPPWFTEVHFDPLTKKRVGWAPVTQAPEDTYFREARDRVYREGGSLLNGTYELIGPKVEKNPEGSEIHILIAHGTIVLDTPAPPRTFDGLRQYLSETPIEGIVFWHPDGRRAKIKARDFGMKRRGFDAI